MLGTALRITQKLSSRLIDPIDRWVYRRFYNYPFGRSPRASADIYREIWIRAKNKEYPPIDRFESNQGYAIDENWLHELALLTQVVVKKSDICYQHGRLLYSALSAYISQSNYQSLNILETGTARGFSSLCMSKALHDAKQPGKVITFDVIPHDIDMYWNCIADENGPMSRSELLRPYQELIEKHILFIQGDTKLQLKKVNIPRIHFAFLDGPHTYDYVLNEFGFLKDKQETGDVVFFDDYTPDLYPGVVKAIDEICKNHGYSKEVVTVSKQRGYVVAQKK